MLQQAVEPYSATGKTVKSIRYEVTPFRLQIFGRQFFSAIETGRGPRKSSQYGHFDDSMLEYMNARGIGSGLSEKKRRQLAKFLAHKINKEGDELFKAGGREVYSDKLDAFIVELEKALTKDFVKSSLTSIKNTVNGTVASV